MKKFSIKNSDGSLNGKIIAGLISLLIVLIQQVLAMFGIKFTGDWGAIVAVINTVLTILGMLGVISDVQTVSAPVATVEEDEAKSISDSAKSTETATETITETETVTLVKPVTLVESETETEK